MAASELVASSFWRQKVSNAPRLRDKTYVKDLKNLLEVQPPGDDRLFIFLRMEMPGDRIPSAPLD